MRPGGTCVPWFAVIQYKEKQKWHDWQNPSGSSSYVDQDGNEPFTDWLYILKDSMGRKRVLIRITRLEQGNYGDCEPVGEGISELRMFFGAGYRVYFGEDADNIVVLLCGGDKGSQKKDIKQAKTYWREYLTHEEL